MKPNTRRHGAARITLGALATLLGLLCAQPALAQFTGNDGLAADGSPKVQAEVMAWLWLPNTNLSVGLDRAPGLDPSTNLPRPTLADVLSKLDATFDCYCLVRYGDFSGEMNLFYLAVSSSKVVTPIPALPSAVVSSKVSTFIISPGVGYRVIRASEAMPFSMDVRAGFTYNQINARANYQGSLLNVSASPSSDFVQPWIGERMNYFPAPKWRIDHTAAITGLGVGGGAIGWNANIGATYLVSNWFDLSFGYAATQTRRNQTSAAGYDNSVNLLLYGPYIGAGFRF